MGSTKMASIDDIFSTLKNIAVALNNANQYYKQGYSQNATNGLSTSTVVKAVAGRLYSVNVTTAGSSTGAIYDSSTVAGAGTSNFIAVIPNSVGSISFNWPVANGIVFVPGSGQVASISYS
jgi:hypothetical protein